MIRPKCTIAGLCGLIVTSAMFLAAFHDPSPTWLVVIRLMTAGILLASIVRAKLDWPRVFWSGYAVFGWGFAVATLIPCPDHNRQLAVVADALYDLTKTILPCPDDDTVAMGPGQLTYEVHGFQRWSAAAVPFPIMTEPEHFREIFRCLEIWAAGWIGGITTVVISARKGKFRLEWPKTPGYSAR